MPPRRVKSAAELLGTTEHDLQAQVIAWRDANAYRHPAIRWIHSTPNGAKMPRKQSKSGGWYSPEAIRQKAEGLTPGILDILIPCAGRGYHGLYIELKRPCHLSEVREGQREFMAYCEMAGYLAVVYDDYDDIIAQITWYLELEA